MLRYIESWLAEGRVDPGAVLHLEGGSIAESVTHLAEAHPAAFPGAGAPTSGWFMPTCS